VIVITGDINANEAIGRKQNIKKEDKNNLIFNRLLLYTF